MGVCGFALHKIMLRLNLVVILYLKALLKKCCIWLKNTVCRQGNPWAVSGQIHLTCWPHAPWLLPNLGAYVPIKKNQLNAGTAWQLSKWLDRPVIYHTRRTFPQSRGNIHNHIKLLMLFCCSFWVHAVLCQVVKRFLCSNSELFSPTRGLNAWWLLFMQVFCPVEVEWGAESLCSC